MKLPIDPERIRLRRQALGIVSNQALAEEADMMRSTLQEILRTGLATKKALTAIAVALKIDEEQLCPEAVESELPEYAHLLTAPRGWEVVSVESPVLLAANGVRYQVAKLRKELLPNRFVRGKFYDLLHVADSKIQELTEKLIRHAQVCLQFADQPTIAKHVDIRPLGENSAWWMLDEWVDSTPLATLLNSDAAFDLDLIKSIGTDLLVGLASLHARKIIVRELAPERILLVDHTKNCIITDFELAKLLDSEISVSGKWKYSTPYRAPEVRDDDPEVQSDLFSWAVIMTEVLTGKTDANHSELQRATASDPVAKLIIKCRDVRYHHRPANAEFVLKSWNNWKPG